MMMADCHHDWRIKAKSWASTHFVHFWCHKETRVKEESLLENMTPRNNNNENVPLLLSWQYYYYSYKYYNLRSFYVRILFYSEHTYVYIYILYFMCKRAYSHSHPWPTVLWEFCWQNIWTLPHTMPHRPADNPTTTSASSMFHFMRFARIAEWRKQMLDCVWR